MDLGRVRTGEWLAGLGGVALLVLLFLPWYGSDGIDANAWQAFAVIDILLLILGLLALAVPLTAASRRPPAVPVAAAVICAGAGIVMTLVVLYRLINQPGPNDVVGVELGAYLGLLAVLAILAGAWRTMADDRTDAAPAPHVPAQPAPPATAAAGSVVATGGVPDAAPPPN